MNFLYPLGLLGLIGIPVIVFIYIIKNKYTEKTIASTYLWNLSERFLKKRVRISRIAGILSLILQIALVAAISLTLAHPVIVLADSAGAYCFVLDGSGSMNMKRGDMTRFEAARGMISEEIEGAAKGSSYTLIFVGTTTETIYKDVTDKDRALSALNALEATAATPDLIGILDEVQAYFNENRAATLLFYTDKKYEESKNVTVVDVTEGYERQENYALTGVVCERKGTQVSVSGKVISYESDAEVTVEFAFGENRAYEKDGEIEVSVAGEGETEFTYLSERSDFSCMRARIAEEDVLAADNEIEVFNVTSENTARTLLVSDNPFYLRAAMTAAGNGSVEVMTEEEYEAGASGYGLYVFDAYSPKEIPRDGAVWFVNPQGTVEGSGFTYQGDASPKRAAVYSSSTATTVTKLLSGVSGTPFELARYVKCGVSGKFYTVASCDGNPVIFTGTNVYGNREAVIAFGLHESASFTLSADCSTLVANLFAYSFPQVLDETGYYCGETMQVNVPVGCAALKIVTPKGAETYLDTTSAVSEYRLSEVGAYGIEMRMRDGTERQFDVYASFPEEERFPGDEGREFIIEGMALDGKSDGVFDELIILFVLLGVLAVADYGVYCYEQYQLR